jgi:hypothetical protein
MKVRELRQVEQQSLSRLGNADRRPVPGLDGSTPLATVRTLFFAH